MAIATQIKEQMLRRERLDGEFATYRAALEWDLADPIVIEDRADLKSEAKWKGRVEPYHHQVTNLMTFCRRLPVTLLADDVGLGKTISAGLVISELAARARLTRVLIVAPKLLGPQWQEELGSKFGVPADVVIGRDLISAEPKEFGAVITTYNSARLYLEKVPPDRFQMLILDEAHKLRNLFGVPERPQVAVTFQKALAERRFRYVLMLTATPVQNRLWDLYSLVDLLSSARGHQNPFGSEGMFYRRFIADERDSARKLKADAKDEFRSIVYGYMSRVRRGDAKLYFPDRRVQMHRIKPSVDELRLIEAIAEPIQKLNRLVQISILQALASSPEALSAQLQNMARNRSVPAELADEVKNIVLRMGRPAKLQGLSILIDRLRAESPDKWRLVIFTTRRETQTSIEVFLSRLGLKVGIINGDTSGRNKETLAQFWAKPPKLNVIVSTEAGAEGVNMQVANVLVNYDLPWNPMIVEQRIGRIQRLGTEHASVGIFNVVLAGTFEEYIVGRLMEKLQLASNAIGDIESLLEASGVGDDAEGGMDEKIRALVVAALAGKDVSSALGLATSSIEKAKAELERERENIDSMLGGMDGAEFVGPRAPSLPSVVRSMSPKDFVVAAYGTLGGRVLEDNSRRLVVEHDGARERIYFGTDNAPELKGSNYQPGTAAFSRLVTRVASAGIHRVEDETPDAEDRTLDASRQWVVAFGGRPRAISVTETQRSFTGEALVRVRALVQHDSYERLIDVPCKRGVHVKAGSKLQLAPISGVLERVSDAGVDVDAVAEAAKLDDAIAEFCRFYLERRQVEVQAAGSDERKRHKLNEDFSPRLELTIAGLSGKVARESMVRVEYELDGGYSYASLVSVDAQQSVVISAPPFQTCASSGVSAPKDCFGRCEISGAEVLKHLLTKSDASGRVAQPQYITRCAASGKTMLVDEGVRSDITGLAVFKDLIKKSGISGRMGEPSYFAQCSFTGVEGLKEELASSELSGRLFRSDEAVASSVSGKSGHKSEFVECFETRLPLALSEAEKCEATGRRVRPGILQTCEETGQKVLPFELGVCSVSRRRVLRRLLVTSSVSGQSLLPASAVVSSAGAYCLPSETIICAWGREASHPNDIKKSRLTGLPIHIKHLSESALVPLKGLLDGIRHNAEETDRWPAIAARLSSLLGGRKCRVIVAVRSPNGQVLAVRAEVRTLFGFRVSHVGFLYSIVEDTIVGRIATGRLTAHGWVAEAA